MSTPTIFTFSGVDCILTKTQYHNTSKHQSPKLALKVVAADTQRNAAKGIFAGEPVATASINVSFSLKPNEVVIKDYFENDGLLAALVNAGLVQRTGRVVPTGMELSEIVICLI